MNRSTPEPGTAPDAAPAHAATLALAAEENLAEEALHPEEPRADEPTVAAANGQAGASPGSELSSPLDGHAKATPPRQGPARTSPAVWGSLLSVGALGAGAVALWTHNRSAVTAPESAPSTSIASPTAGPPGATLFTAPGVQPTASASQPLFPGLGLPGTKGGPQPGAKAAPFVAPPGKASAPGGKKGTPVAVPNVPPAVQAAFTRAVEAQKAGRADEAIRSYREVLRLKPDAVEARANLAILFVGQKQFGRAVEQLKAARKLAPRHPAIAFQLGQALVQDKRPAEAVEHLRFVTRADPKSPAPQLLLAQVLSQLKRPRPALEAWERLCRLDPKSSEAALAAGAMALEGTKEPARAAKWLRKAAALAPAEPGEPLLLGRALMAQRKPKEAAQVLQKGFAQFPKAIEIGTLLSDARIASGDLPGATATLREVIKRVPESQGNGAPAGQLRIALARLLAGQKKWAPALAQVDEAARLLPRDADVRGMGVDIALRSGNWQAARDNLEQMISIDSKRFPARVLVAREAARQGQLAVADDQYAKYLKARSGDAAVTAERAVVLERLKRPDEADALWKKAQILLPNSPLPGLQRARALQEAGRDKAALDAYRFVLQNFSGDPNALLGAAELEMKLGQPARAVAHWKALAAARPEYEPAYPALLEAARQVDQVPSALGFLKQQAARNPNREAIYEAVLNLHARQGRAAEGRAWVSNLARLYPSSRAPRRALAEFARRFPSLARDEAPAPKPTPAAAPKPTAAPATSSTSPAAGDSAGEGATPSAP